MGRQSLPEASAELSASIRDMLTRLEEHLNEEERDVVPLIAAHLTEAEWAQVWKKSFDKFTPPQRFTAMGQMLEVATPAEAVAMMEILPPPVKVLWSLIGKRRYRRYIEPVRGTPHAGR